MINVNEILHRLIAEFQSIEQVTAIAMAGSKFSNYQDDLSDININIYYTEFIPSETRNQILMKFSESMELDCLEKYKPTIVYFGISLLNLIYVI